MHFFPLIAVEADSDDEAVSAAEIALEQYQGDVWDWHNPDEDHFDDGVVAIRYSDDPGRFLAELDCCRSEEQKDLDLAVHDMRTQVGSLELLLKGALSDATARDRLSSALYRLGKLLDPWTFFGLDTTYYDGVEEVASEYDAVRGRCQEDPESQWLVAMNLHC